MSILGHRTGAAPPGSRGRALLPLGAALLLVGCPKASEPIDRDMAAREDQGTTQAGPDADLPDQGLPDQGRDSGMDAGDFTPTLRVVNEDLEPVRATVVIDGAGGTRRVTGAAVELTPEELEEGFDLVAYAAPLDPTGLVGFRADDLALLDEVDGLPALVLPLPLVTDPVEVLLPIERLGDELVVQTVPLGYGGGTARRGEPVLVQRSAEVTALLAASDPFTCPQRIELPDLTEVGDVLSLPSAEGEEVDCDAPTARLTPPDGFAITGSAVVARLSRNGRPIQDRGGGVVYGFVDADVEGSVDAFDVAMALVPADLPRRDHPSIDVPLQAWFSAALVSVDDPSDVRSGLAELDRRWDDGEIVELEAFEFRLPLAGSVLGGLELIDDGRGTRTQASVATVGPSPSDEALVIAVEGLSVIGAPGVAAIDLRRVILRLEELVGAEGLQTRSYPIGGLPPDELNTLDVIVYECGVAFRPLPACTSEQRFLTFAHTGAFAVEIRLSDL
ncbi:MAG: hypothetical protein ACFCGT_02895 [Sandaracinaceae bacterium]